MRSIRFGSVAVVALLAGLGLTLGACSSSGGGGDAGGGTAGDATATPDTGQANQGDATPSADTGTSAGADATTSPDTGNPPPPTDASSTDLGGGPGPDTAGPPDASSTDTSGSPDSANTGGDASTPPLDGTGIPTDTECGQIVDCVLTSCANGPSPECIASCKEGKSTEASTAFDALMECVVPNCGTDVSDVCVSKFCADEFTACIGSALPTASGCAPAWFCWLECLPNDSACQNACGSMAGEDGGAFGDVTNCLAGKCPKPLKSSCLAQNVSKGGACEVEAATCAPAGTQVCTSLVDCVLQSCDPGDLSCQAECFLKGSPDAGVYAAKFVECLERTCNDDANCDDPHSDEWFNTAQSITCGTEWSNCFQQGQ